MTIGGRLGGDVVSPDGSSDAGHEGRTQKADGDAYGGRLVQRRPFHLSPQVLGVYGSSSSSTTPSVGTSNVIETTVASEQPAKDVIAKGLLSSHDHIARHLSYVAGYSRTVHDVV